MMSNLVCAICLYCERGRPRDAELIVCGTSVCVPHAESAKHESTTIRQAKARIDEMRADGE